MTGAFIYLLYHSWVNLGKMRLRRLKQPKYLFGALVGVLYFYFYFYRFVFRFAMHGGGVSRPEDAAWQEPMQASFLLVAVLFLAWILPKERGLVFSEAEVAFLFPAPVGRKKLVHYKLIKSQVSILFMVLFVTIVSGAFRMGSIAVFRVAGWWMILSTLNLHLVGASLTREILFNHGLTSWKRRVLVLGLVAALAAWVTVWAKGNISLPDVANFSGASDFKYYFEHLADAGPMHYILYPFRMVVRPRMQTDWPSFLQAAWPVALIIIAHYLWVTQSDVAFEEASADYSRKLAERIATMRANRGQWQFKPKKKKRPPFTLQPRGFPAVGFLWKNLISAGHVFTTRLLIILVGAAVVSAILMSTEKEGNWVSSVGLFSLILLYMSYLVGPQFLRQDFRQDIPMADLLKSYPMSGLQMALGELLAPATLLTCLQWLLIIFALGTTSRLLGKSFGLEWRLAVGAGMAIIAPGLNMVMLIIPNAAVLLFPGWFQTGRTGPQGIEAMGQRLIFTFGQLFTLLLALIPAALVFVVVGFIARMVAGQFIAIPVGACGVLLTLLGEAFLGLLWLGRLFQKFDVATEGASQS